MDATQVHVWKYVNGIRTLLHDAHVSVKDSIRCNISQYTWYQHAKTHQVFATLNGKRVYLQDVLMGSKGPWVHVNGDPWDFRNENLAKVNRGIRTVKRSNKTSVAVGVCFVASRNRWRANISGKLIGYFKTEKEAIDARLKELRGLSPMIKFVPEGTDPDGPTGMKTRTSYNAEGGRPDAYLDLDDVETTPLAQVPVSYGMEPIKDRDYWKTIPPPDTF